MDFETNRLDRLTAEIYETAGEHFDISDPAQLGEILFDKFGIAGGKKNVFGVWVTDSDALEELAAAGHTLPRLVLEHRCYGDA